MMMLNLLKQIICLYDSTKYLLSLPIKKERRKEEKKLKQCIQFSITGEICIFM